MYRSYAISLLANLNARSYRPPPIHTDSKDDHGDNGRAVPLSSMHFAAGRVHNLSEVNATSGNGIFSFVRSIARTIHRDLTTIPSEDALQGDVDAQSGNAEGLPGLMHNRVTEREVISAVD